MAHSLSQPLSRIRATARFLFSARRPRAGVPPEESPLPAKIVVTLHGIRTRGTWQKEVTPYLARHGLIPYHLDYGWFGVLSFVLPWTRARRVQWLRGELRDLVDRTGAKKVSIIAIGSGGAYAQAAARALVQHTELSPEEIVKKSLEIAGDLCIYTNQNHTIETLGQMQ